MEDEPERQRGFDGEIGILQLPATCADAHGLPSGDRVRGQPHGDIASLDQRSVVCRPIPDVVVCLVLWVHARLHVEIMHLLSPRGPGGRSWLTEGAGSVHQRPRVEVGATARDEMVGTDRCLRIEVEDPVPKIDGVPRGAQRDPVPGLLQPGIDVGGGLGLEEVEAPARHLEERFADRLEVLGIAGEQI